MASPSWLLSPIVEVFRGVTPSEAIFGAGAGRGETDASPSDSECGRPTEESTLSSSYEIGAPLGEK